MGETNHLPLKLLDEIEQDLIEALDWYATQSQAAADRFDSEVDWVLSQIEEAPFRWRNYRGVRRMSLPHFPYHIIYRVKPGFIQVLAVMHAKRRPEYWRYRLKV